MLTGGSRSARGQRGLAGALANLALALNTVSLRHAELGQVSAAVAAAEEAVGIFRDLVRANAVGIEIEGESCNGSHRPVDLAVEPPSDRGAVPCAAVLVVSCAC
ncbi:hypothetical protein [Micromonospora parathelypteridis]|uniref:Uncharacterized protein n=1 Tax=Micromonospora parathelypteridis TaxID=1839617 RepID=A0A840VTN6_9ACTN|nr:hypothetical protein [Micromonospora parathelypteridis]MBB5480633.1 hypothetical protein [Micromonospora parathelypteridis]GGO22432.1 hypothetical protein GCM10011576_41750 [Micromonospora parathelypteridis]